MIDLAMIDALTGGRVGVFDVICPECSPHRSHRNQNKRVLRIWRIDPDFAGYHCAHCDASGHARDQLAPPPDRAALARAKAEAEQRRRDLVADRRRTAQWLWSRRKPIRGTIAETYLREARGYGGTIPATVAYLAPRGGHGPAMISAFGFPIEPAPGIIKIRPHDVVGVHLTRLRTDGRGKAGSDKDKIMIGHTLGVPIVVAPPNDLLALVVTEGVEDALSSCEATGRGAWAAGSASRLPALADKVPSWIEVVAIWVDGDTAGERHAFELARRLDLRGITAIRQPRKAQVAA